MTGFDQKVRRFPVISIPFPRAMLFNNPLKSFFGFRVNDYINSGLSCNLVVPDGGFNLQKKRFKTQNGLQCIACVCFCFDKRTIKVPSSDDKTCGCATFASSVKEFAFIDPRNKI